VGRHGGLYREGHRVPALEVRTAGARFLLPAVVEVRRWARGLGDYGRARGLGPTVRGRGAGVQRDRHPAIVSAGRGGGGTASARVREAGRSVRTFQLRDGGAFAAVLRGPGDSAQRGGQPEELRRGLGAQGAGGEGGRPDRPADREGAGGSGVAKRGAERAGESCGGDRDGGGGAALLHAEVNAQDRDRVRPAGGE